MKTIRKGRKQKGWAEEFVCTGSGNGNGGCGATLLVEKGDLFYTESHALHETEYHTTFRCEQCGVLTDVTTPFRTTELPYAGAWFKARGIPIPRNGR